MLFLDFKPTTLLRPGRSRTCTDFLKGNIDRDKNTARGGAGVTKCKTRSNWAIHIINPVDKTKLSFKLPTDTAPQFLEKLNPLLIRCQTIGNPLYNKSEEPSYCYFVVLVCCFLFLSSKHLLNVKWESVSA